uniref:Uncharacterized protein n=1 Tax=Brassica campestris TaxID=3711 RepID=M4DP71_BRACM
MLQWMGGSRRKVAARRRQQHQFTAGSGSCSYDRNSSNQHQSLDILNFISLSTPATPECKPSPPEDVKQVVEDRDAGFHSLKDNITGVELSVFDLVGDDYTTTNRKECSPSEPHMAFSVEGLGKINTETPPSSPQPSSRNFAYGCSSPWNDSGQPISNVRERLSDFEKERDIIESSKMFQDDKRYRSPIDIHATYGGTSQKLRTSTDHLHKPYISDSRGYFCDTADFNKSRVFDENEWNAKPTFPDDGVGRFYWKDQQPRQEESLNLNFNNYGRDYTGSRSSAEHHATKKRDYLETTWRSNIEGSPVRRPQCLERAIDHPSFEQETTLAFNFDKVFDPPVWSSVVLEEDKDNHSLRSEESCSSSAAWANETSISHETNTRQRKGEIDSFCNLGNKKYLNNGLSYESWEDWDVDDQQLKRKVGSGKQVRLSNPGKLRSTSHRDSSSRGGLDAPYNWFAEGFTAAGISSDITTERDKPYPFLNPVVGSSHRRQSRAPDSIPETWVPKFSTEGSGYGDDEHNYMNCVSANHNSKLAGDVCSFGSDTLSENDNEQSKEVNDPKNQGDETSSSVAKSLSDENEYVRCNPNKEVVKARHQGDRGGEKTSRDSHQQMIMLERRTLQFVCLNKTLLLDSLKT